MAFKGTTTGGITNFDGEYFLQTKDNVKSLLVSYVGYKKIEVPIKQGIFQTLNFALEHDDVQITEVVIVAGENPAHRILRNIIENKTAIVCPIKHFIGLPCPSCGSTRSVISLLKGNFTEAFYINPIGYLIATIMVVLPLWIFSDVLLRQNSLQHFYMKLERRIVKPMFAIPLILLLIMNWFWNISKSL